MKLKVFCVHDSKASAFLQPFFFPATGQALRAWETTVNDPQTQFNKYPSDFTLYEIGTFDDELAHFEMLEHRVVLGCAADYIRPGMDPKLLGSPVVSKLNGKKDHSDRESTSDDFPF